jgi:nucleotide-binding universal stress UspA family protein
VSNAELVSNSDRIIVIGVDYSDHSIVAVDEAVRGASSGASRHTRLVPVLVLPGGPVTGQAVAEEMTAEVIERSRENLVGLLESRASRLGLELPPVEARVRFGKPAEQLIAEARELGASMIAIGTHGRKALSHFFLGSVAEEVMREAPCSVLVARATQSSDAVVATEHDADDIPSSSHTPRPISDDAVLVAEPHIDAGRVLMHILDVPSGQVFSCAFEDIGTVIVQPLEGDWVPAPSSDARARVARAAHAVVSRNRSLFGELFDEIGRRQNILRRSGDED